MNNMGLQLEWTDGTTVELETAQAAAELVRGRYPEMVIYDAGAFARDDDDDLEDYDIRSGRVALYWETEEASEDDDGSHSVAELVERDSPQMCESCAEGGYVVPAVGHSENLDWSGYWLCEECIREYNSRAPLEPEPQELVYSKRLQTVGNSLCVIVDRSVADALGVDRGDWVQVTIRRV